MGSKFDNAFKAQAIRLVRDHVGEYPSEWAAISAVSFRLGMSAETLRLWLRQEEQAVGAAHASGAGDDGSARSDGSAAEIRELKRKNAELERTIEILKAASAFFLRECDPLRH